MPEHSTSPFHPARLIATIFGIGRLRYFSPEITGSLLAMLLFAVPGFMDSRALSPMLWLVCGVSVVLGFFSSIWFMQRIGARHSRDIIIDAFAGMLLAVVVFFVIRDYAPLPVGKSKFYTLFMSGGFYTLVPLFLLFKFFQGWRIGLARITTLAGETRGGTALMTQAISAAVFAAVCLHAIVLIMEYLRQPGFW